MSDENIIEPPSAIEGSGQVPPPPPPPPFQQPQPYNGPGPKNDGFAITSMVTGIVGAVTICCYPLSFILAIIATVFGFISINKVKNSNGMLGGKGMAIAGVVLGLCVLALLAIWLILWLVGVATSDFSTSP